MTDDLDDLKALMTDATPTPDAARRQTNLEMAQANFTRLQAASKPPARAGLWTRSTTWASGAFASLAVVASAVILIGPMQQPMVQNLPAPDLMVAEEAAITFADDAAIAGRSAPAVAALSAESYGQAQAAPSARIAKAPNFEHIRATLQSGRLPDPAMIDVSVFLTAFAENLFSEGQVQTIATPWDNATQLMLASNVSFLVSPGVLLGQGQTRSGLVDLYEIAPTSPSSLDQSNVGFAAALAGFAYLLGDPDTLGAWSFDDAITLAQEYANGDPMRIEAIAMMQQARDL